MKKPKKFNRVWIKSRKKGERGHWSHCRQGHPWAGPGACAPCRAAKDAARHGTEEAKAKAAERKQDLRWRNSKDLKTEDLGEGFFADFWRGSWRIREGEKTIILPPMAAMRLCLALCDRIELTPPSKLPKGIREVGEAPAP